MTAPAQNLHQPPSANARGRGGANPNQPEANASQAQAPELLKVNNISEAFRAEYRASVTLVNPYYQYFSSYECFTL